MCGRDTTFLRGVEQFNQGEFFQAHETWEMLWLQASGRDKIFLQGTIQLAAAFHHWACGNPRGAASLLHRGMEKLKGFPRSYWGIRVDRLRGQAGRWAAALGSNGTAIAPPAPALPKIELESVSPTRPQR